MRLRNRNLIRFVARLLAFVCRCLYATCRIRVIETTPQTSPYRDAGGKCYVYCVWHDGILNALFCGHVTKGAALTSRHTDGEYVAQVMEVLGIKPIRGSQGGSGGASAARQLMEAAADYHIVVTTDGPRGPRRQIKPGIFFLASQTGCSILPVAASAKRAWRPRGRWTDLLVPLPFTTAYVVGGEPMFIPPDLSRSELRQYCEDLQNRMDQLQELADGIARGECEIPAAPVSSHRSSAA